MLLQTDLTRLLAELPSQWKEARRSSRHGLREVFRRGSQHDPDSASRLVVRRWGHSRPLSREASRKLKTRKLDVAQRADILAGTSTGAIVAAALALGKDPKRITDLYTEVGEKVFPPRSRVKRAFDTAWWYVSGAPYSSAVLRKALEEEFKPATKLGDCDKRLIIPAISLNQYKLKVFDSADDSDKDYGLVDVVMASAAAPTYFQPAKVGET